MRWTLFCGFFRSKFHIVRALWINGAKPYTHPQETQKGALQYSGKLGRKQFSYVIARNIE